MLRSIPGIEKAESLYKYNGFEGAAAILILFLGLGAVSLAIMWAYQRIKPAKTESASICSKDTCPFGYEGKSATELVRHPVFSAIAYATVVRIPQLRVPDLGRRLVFQALLVVKFNAIRSCLTAWLEKNINSIEHMTSDQLYSELVGLTTCIVSAYESSARERGIPVEVINTFREWHKRRVDALMEEIDLICGSDAAFSGSISMMGYFMTYLEHLSGSTMLDAERTIKSLNGTLTGIVFDGVVLGPCGDLKKYKSGVHHV